MTLLLMIAISMSTATAPEAFCNKVNAAATGVHDKTYYEGTAEEVTITVGRCQNPGGMDRPFACSEGAATAEDCYWTDANG